MRELTRSNSVEIAQHGYQHILVHRPGAAILGQYVGIAKPGTEFAGDSYSDQLFRIREGQRILRRNGLETKFWMAPNHSFDHNTLRALVECGFSALSDGTSLFPYKEDGLIFVPQTSWQPRWMPFGVQTVCLHTNTITPLEVKRLRRFIRHPFNFMSFSEVVNRSSANKLKQGINGAFSVAYRSGWMLRGLTCFGN
jgi:predicted deacetylase